MKTAVLVLGRVHDAAAIAPDIDHGAELANAVARRMDEIGPDLV